MERSRRRNSANSITFLCFHSALSLSSHLCFRSQDDESCLGLPYVSNGSFHNENNQSDLLKIIVETQARYLEPQSNYESIHFPKEEDGEVQCVYFRRGFCAKGNGCEFSHSAVCKFFLSGDGCRYGAHCRYKHDSDVPRWDNRLELDEDVAQFPTVLCSSTRNSEGTMLVFGREALSYIHQLQDLATASCNDDSQLEAEKYDRSSLHRDPGLALENPDPSGFFPRRDAEEFAEISNLFSQCVDQGSLDIAVFLFFLPAKYRHAKIVGGSQRGRMQIPSSCYFLGFGLGLARRELHWDFDQNFDKHRSSGSF
ncbi:uncharacterized protein LOC9637450 isoform X1 [Selaginella moellendorffii]|uniref:uncharacterized protein LOC9637450 isoform X1 n=1 Tax=Selaginella moellendorffii TaxID=88036 RepID=UPI000D1CA4CE|nr:uncharacterized protein LOC9637450 isoform X1 [Selaginella moellendorffii]XP_024533633.1 uncharacterized protein LOC9637450 isoform X1 [Selaginella moellendorffii]|eukprot:XP_024533631.1 uncharacterized protein LOC9637450 isoform X1 [Selaginella moellendorffii]